MTLSAFSFRMLRRDLHAGELRVLFLAIIIATASVSSVGFFTDRVQQALRQQANELLAADLVISADHPISEQFIQTAKKYDLRFTQSEQFRSMVLANGKNSLAEVKAVGPGYPLRGHLHIAKQIFGPERVTEGLPAQGTVWLEAELMRRLDVHVGDMITLGSAKFKISAVLTYEPDRAGNLFNIAPRLLMDLSDLPATQLVQVGSRINYRLLLAGSTASISTYRKAVTKKIGRGERLVDVIDARAEVRDALDRAKRFLGLAALVSVMLAGVAVAMAARRFVERHLDTCAIMRCLGARQTIISRVYLLEMIWLGLLASLIGCAIGYIAHLGLVEILGQLVVSKLPLPSIMPAVFGFITGMAALLAFAVPPLMHLKRVPTLRVLRRELGALGAPTFSAYLLGIAVISGMLIWQAGEVRLGAYVLMGLLGTVIVLSLCSLALVKILRLFRNKVGVAWRFGLANISRRAKESVVQVLAFGVGIMALLLLTVVRNDLLQGWQNRLPPDTPNRFIINIQKDQIVPMKSFFKEQGVTVPQIYPMVRGRLIAINNQPIAPENYEETRARRLVEREFNLSWSEGLPQDNEVVTGHWWNEKDNGKNLFSVEQGIANLLDIKVGDNLTYSIAGEKFNGQVANLRKVEWDSFRVNFFVLTPPGVINEYPASYITSFYIPEDKFNVLNQLVQHFPNFTIINVSAILNQVRDIIQRVSDAIQYVFLFTLLAGMMVLYAAIQTTHDERVRESAVLRTLGANHRQLMLGLVSEFVTLGLLSGLIAALAASVLGYVLAAHVLHVPYSFDPWIWFFGLVGGGVGVGLAGYLGTRSTLNRPPLPTLRSTEA